MTNRISAEVTATTGEPVVRHRLRLALGIGDAGALAHEVNHAARRHVPTRPTRALRLPAIIHFFEIEKVAFIHQADLIDDLAANDHARAGHPISGVSDMSYRGCNGLAMQQFGDNAQSQPRL